MDIRRQFSLPGSDRRGETEALYEYKLGLVEGRGNSTGPDWPPTKREASSQVIRFKMTAVLRTKRLWIVIIVGIAFLYPFKSTVVSSQNVLVITDEGKPIQNALVRQIWQHYSLESRSHEEDLRTGPNGRVTFPERTIRASLARRVVYPIWILAKDGVHASFGVRTDMFPLRDVAEKRVTTQSVEAQPGDVVFRVREIN